MVQNNALKVIAISFLASWVTPALTAVVDCEYHSKSEWPWLDSRVCQYEPGPLLFNDANQVICTDPRADKDGDGWGWENDQSCLIDPNITEKESNVPSPVIDQEDLVVFEQDFESAGTGLYSAEVLNKQWDTPMWHMGLREGRATIVQDNVKGNALQVLYPAHAYGSKGAVAFLSDLSFGVSFEQRFEELYVSYDIKFSEDFDFVRGGKLPGLCGYNETMDPEDGCNTGGGFPTGYDGFSARGMWREDAILESYIYHADQFYEYGDDEYWDLKAIRGKWHTVQHRVVLNTPGEANGIIEAWLDGVKVLSANNMNYRKTADIGINLFYFSTFYGGADPSWAPTTDQYITFDNFRIATSPLEGTDSAPLSVKTDEAVTPALAAIAPATESTTSSNKAGTAEASSVPKIAAAQAAESGGGLFYAWLPAILVLMRRRFYIR